MTIQGALGHLFLVAGSPSRAAAAYQTIIDQDPESADAHAGLREAELELGQYRDAHTAFLAALRYKPQDAAIRRQLELSNTLTDLDPTPRRLTSGENIAAYSHSSVGLRRPQCVSFEISGTPSPETTQLLSAAHDTLTAKPPSNATNELSEGVLGITEKIWKTRVATCGTSVSPQEEPLRLIIESLPNKG